LTNAGTPRNSGNISGKVKVSIEGIRWARHDLLARSWRRNRWRGAVYTSEDCISREFWQQKGLERAGYWASHRSVLPFGIDYLVDIQRLCSTQGITIKCVLDVGAFDGRSAVDFLAAFPDAEIH
jgi:hypothetical protein